VEKRGELEERIKIKEYFCPERHSVHYRPWSVRIKKIEGRLDKNGEPLYERYLYCFGCNRFYLTSKLEEHN